MLKIYNYSDDEDNIHYKKRLKSGTKKCFSVDWCANGSISNEKQ